MGSLIKYFHDCSDCMFGVIWTQANDPNKIVRVECRFHIPHDPTHVCLSVNKAMENCPFRTAENKMIKFVLQEDKPNP